MQVKTLNQILKIEFELPQYHMYEWYEIHLYRNGILIRSGLRHADGETISPYYYSETTRGKGHKKKAIKKFNEFLKQFECQKKD